jgi:hypothetical protein
LTTKPEKKTNRSQADGLSTREYPLLYLLADTRRDPKGSTNEYPNYFGKPGRCKNLCKSTWKNPSAKNWTCDQRSPGEVPGDPVH